MFHILLLHPTTLRLLYIQRFVFYRYYTHRHLKQGVDGTSSNAVDPMFNLLQLHSATLRHWCVQSYSTGTPNNVKVSGVSNV